MRSPGHEILEIGPSKHTIIATLVVALYASFLPFHFSESNDRLESSWYADMNVNCGNFHVDQIRDLHIPTA
jgi:hypothetical protein